LLFVKASEILSVAEKNLFFVTLSKILSNSGSSSKGYFPELIEFTNSVLISTPIVDKFLFANDNAVGSPIRPIPITHTLILFLDKFSEKESTELKNELMVKF
jgi:hypothetical protein